MSTNAEILFFKLLNLLAIQAGQELTQDQIQLYDRNLARHGYEKTFPILDQILKEQRPGQPMPSIHEIERRLTKETQVSDKAQANTIVQNLIRCVGKYGHTWPLQGNYNTEFILKLGSLGAELVRLHNGWPNFVERCNEAQDNMETFKAQLRDLALGVIERSKLGFKPKEMPELITDKPHQLILELTGAVKSLPKGERV